MGVPIKAHKSIDRDIQTHYTAEKGVIAIADYLSPDEAAARLNVAPATIRKWCRDGKLPCIKLGRLWRIRETDLNRLKEFPRE